MKKMVKNWWFWLIIILLLVICIESVILINIFIKKYKLERTNIQYFENEKKLKKEVEEKSKRIEELNKEEEQKKIQEKIEKLNSTKEDKESEINTLEESKKQKQSEIDKLNSQINNLKSDIIKIKGQEKLYPAGYLVAGKDFEIGRYKIYGGSSNFFVRTITGNLKVNIILGGEYGVNEYIYEFSKGDEIEANSSFKMVLIE